MLDGDAPGDSRAHGSTTRSAILAATEAQFSGTGFRKSLLTQITERAGLTTGALYRYFDGKAALLETLFGEFDRRLLHDLERSQTVLEAMTAWLDTSRALPGTLQACDEATKPGSELAEIVGAARSRWISEVALTLPSDATARKRGITAELLCDMVEQYASIERMGWVSERPTSEVAACIAALVEGGTRAR